MPVLQAGKRAAERPGAEKAALNSGKALTAT
jgi:hypothetical protein